jgi:hypothetical protein
MEWCKYSSNRKNSGNFIIFQTLLQYAQQIDFYLETESMSDQNLAQTLNLIQSVDSLHLKAEAIFKDGILGLVSKMANFPATKHIDFNKYTPGNYEFSNAL